MSDGSTSSGTDPYEALRDLPPSCKLVYKTLEYEGPMTQEALLEASKLSARTVRYAIRSLEESDLVATEVYLPDARQRIYRLRDRDERA